MVRYWCELQAHVIQHLRVSCIAFVISITCGGSVFAAEEAPQSFTYQGRFFNAAGTNAIADGTYTVKFSIYDPSGSCLLYQESQSVTTVNGFFSTQVGSAVADLKRVAGVDPTLSMQDVFSNKIKAVRPVAAPNCAAGYIPALGDGRKLKVENVTLGVVLSPDQTISSVPHAIVAESIQGITPQNFVQIYPTGLPAAGTTLSDDTIAADGADAYKMKQWDSTAGTWTEIKVLHPNSIHQAGAAAQQVLKWDGTNWAPGNDLDTAAGTMNGDVVGSYAATKVIALQNRPVAATAPAATEVLAWDGSTWKPTPAGGPPSGAASGDLLGTYPAPYVSKIHGIAITSSVPNSGDVLKYNGATWVYTSSSTTGGVASGDLSGTYPGPTVAKLQGNAISATAPSVPGQVLTWTGTEWAAASSNTLSDNLYVNITGDTMTGHLRVANSLTATGTIYSDSNIQMNATAINGLANPTLAQDAVTKIYADTKLGSLAFDTVGVAIDGTGTGKFLKWDGDNWVADSIPAGNPGTVTAVVEGHGIVITGDSITSSGTVTADTLTLSTRTYAASKLGGLDLDTTGVATGGTGTDFALKWDGNKWVTYDPQATNDARYVNTAGDTMTGKLTMNDNIVMAGHTITQLGLSTETDSATNKAYVDALIANVGGSMSDFVRKTGDTMSGLLNVSSDMHVSGNVGIGNTNPAANLHVNVGDNTVFMVGSSISTERSVVATSGNVGTGPKVSLSRTGDWNTPQQLQFNTNGSTYWSMGVRGDVTHGDDFFIGTANNPAAPGFVIDRTTGNVGVGAVAPSQKMEISGAIKISTTTDSSAGVIRWTGTDFEGFDGTNWKSMTGVGAAVGDITDVVAGHGLSGGAASGSATLTADTLTLSTRTYAASKLGGLDLDTNGVATGGTGTDYALKWDGNKWVTYDPVAANDSRYVNTAGDTMTGKLTMNDNIVMAGHTITQLGTSSETDSATNKAYVDAVVANSAANYVRIAGDTMTGHLRVANSLTATGTLYADGFIKAASSISATGVIYSNSNIEMNSTKVIGMADPTAAQDAATKMYVDSKLGSLAFDTAGVATGGTGAGMFLKWDGNKWIADTIPGGNPGTVTAVVAGHGISITGDSITSSGSVTADTLTLSTRTYAASKLGGLDLDTNGVATGGTGTDFALKWDGNKWVTYDPQSSGDSRYVNTAGDTMTGALMIPAGTAALPSLTFAGDPNTGMFSSGADTLSFSTAGTARVTIDSQGYVGVGNASPTQKLDISGAIKISTTTDSSAGVIRWTGTDFEGFDGSNWKSMTGVGAGTGDITDVVAGHGLSGGAASGSATLTADTLTLSTRTYAASKLGGLDLDTTGVATGGTGTDFALKWDGNKWVTYDPVAANDSRYVNTAGDTMTGKLTMNDNIVMAGHTITQLGTSSETDSATNKAYVDAVVANSAGNYVRIAGDTMTGHLRVANSLTATGTLYADGFIKAASSISATGIIYSNSDIVMNSTKVTGMADPTAAQDAATKMYVDSKLGSLAFDTVGVAADGTGAGKFLKWDGDNWVADTIPGGNPGTVTAVVEGYGITIVGDSITSSGSVTADTLTLSTRTYAASKLGGLDLDTTGVATGGTGTDYSLKWDGNKWVTYDPQATNDSRYVNTAGDTMTGKLTMNDNIVMAGHTITQLGTSSETDSATNKAYVDAVVANSSGNAVLRTGDTMSGLLKVGSSMHVTGNVGVGTTAPVHKMQFKGSNDLTADGIAFSNNANDVPLVGMAYDQTNDGLALRKNEGAGTLNATALFIKRIGGNVGIGTVVTPERLNIDGAIKIGTSSDSSAGVIRWTGSDFEGFDGSTWKSMTGVGAGAGDITGASAGHGMTGGGLSGDVTLTADTLTLSTRTYAASKLGGLDLDTTGVATGGTGTDFALKWDGNKWVTFDPVAANDSRYVNTAGDTMTGKLTMNDNIVMAGHTITQLGTSSETDSATNKAYVDAVVANSSGNAVLRAGDTMTGLLKVGSSMHVTGNIGVGTTSPQVKLHVVGGVTDTALALENSAAPANKKVKFIETTNTGFFNIGRVDDDYTSNSVEDFTITDTGFVGIGITSASTALDVDGAISMRGTASVPATSGAGNSRMYTDTSGVIQVSQNNGAYAPLATTSSLSNYVVKTGDTMSGALVGTKFQPLDGSAVLPSYSFSSDATSGMFLAGSTLGFSVSGTEIMRMNSAGFVGIGTTTPSSNLSFSGTSDQVISLERNTNPLQLGKTLTIRSGSVKTGASNKSAGDLILSSGTATGTGSSNIQLMTSPPGANGVADNTPVTAMMILGSGNVGIGEVSPAEKLHVSGAIKIGTTSTSSEGVIRWTGTDFEGFDGSNWKSMTGVGAGTGDITDVVAGHGLTGGAASGSATLTADTLTLSTRTYAASKLGGLDLDTTGVATGGTGTDYALKWDGNKWVTYDPQATNDVRYVNTAGDTMTGKLTMNDNIVMAGHTITQLGLSSETDSATNKAYVDALIANVGGSISDFVRKSGDTMTGLLKVGSSMHVTSAVGIGTTAPQTKLHVVGGATDTVFVLENSAAPVNKRVRFIETTSTGAMHFGRIDDDYTSNGIENMTITDTGNIGIGITSASTALDVNGAFSMRGTASVPATSGAGNSRMYTDTSGVIQVSQNNGAYAPLATTSSLANYVLKTGDTMSGLLNVGSSMHVTGNLGVGTTTPDGVLDVDGTDVYDIYLRAYAGGGTGGDIFMGDPDSLGNGSLFKIDDGANQFTFMNGDVGIGVVPTAYKLHVAGSTKVDGTSDVSQLVVESHSTQTTKPFVMQNSSATEVFAITASGYQYLNGAPFIHTTGSTLNTSVGLNAFSTSATGTGNTAFGNYALPLLTSGFGNTAIGQSSLKDNTSGYGNTAVGRRTLFKNDAGYQNVAIGYDAMYSSITSGKNVAIGYHSLYANTTGEDNVAIGYNAVDSLTTGARNVGVGTSAVTSTTSSSDNVGVGYGALAVATGGRNTAIGSYAGYSTTGYGNVYIGNDAGKFVSGNDKLYIANNDTTTLIYGDFANNRVGIGVAPTTDALEVNGNVKATELILSSDRNLKKDITKLDSSLAKILKLQGVQYKWRTEQYPERNFDNRMHIGFIAQEVAEIFPEVVHGEEGNMGVDYPVLVAPLAEAIKEQQDMIVGVEAQCKMSAEQLNKKVETLSRSVASLEATVQKQNKLIEDLAKRLEKLEKKK